jgi:hypothetical protein
LLQRHVLLLLLPKPPLASAAATATVLHQHLLLHNPWLFAGCCLLLLIANLVHVQLLFHTSLAVRRMPPSTTC